MFPPSHLRDIQCPPRELLGISGLRHVSTTIYAMDAVMTVTHHLERIWATPDLARFASFGRFSASLRVSHSVSSLRPNRQNRRFRPSITSSATTDSPLDPDTVVACSPVRDRTHQARNDTTLTCHHTCVMSMPVTANISSVHRLSRKEGRITPEHRCERE